MEDADSMRLREKLIVKLLGLQDRLRASVHDLTYLFWECTLRCDLNCQHCGSDCTVDHDIEDMPLPVFLSVLDEVAGAVDPSGVTVCITGGEPTLRQDLEACVYEISSRGFPAGMVTNGWSLTPSRVKALEQAGLRMATVSLDGLRDNHDRLRGRSGSFDRACGAVRDLSRSSVLPDVVTCVHPGNLAELPELAELLQELGAVRWRLTPVFPRGRAAGNATLQLDRVGLLQLLNFIRGARSTGGIHVTFGCEGYLGEWEGTVRDHRFRCLAGIDIASVLADGSISGCPSLRGDFVQGNINEDGFMDTWENRFEVMRDRRWARTGQCHNCKAWGACLGGALHLRSGTAGEPMRCSYRTLMEQEQSGLDLRGIGVNL